MNIQPETQIVFDAAIEAYGFDGAKLLLGEVLDSIEYANDILRPPVPVDRIGLGVAPHHMSPMRIYGSHPFWSGIELMLGNMSVPRIYPQIRPTVVHEVTHMARYQHGIRNGEYEDHSTFLPIDFVINEGVSVHAEVEHTGDAYLSCYDDSEEGLKDFLRAALGAEGMTDDERYHFLEDDDMRGYKAGHFVVATMAESGYDLDMLIKLPYADYREVVRDLL